MNFNVWLENLFQNKTPKEPSLIGYYSVILKGKPTIAYFDPSFDHKKPWVTFFDENEKYSTEEFDEINQIIRFNQVKKPYNPRLGRSQFKPNSFYPVKIKNNWTIGYYDPSFDQERPWTTFFNENERYSTDEFDDFGLRITFSWFT